MADFIFYSTVGGNAEGNEEVHEEVRPADSGFTPKNTALIDEIEDNPHHHSDFDGVAHYLRQ
jgi:hypothetical protein